MTFDPIVPEDAPIADTPVDEAPAVVEIVTSADTVPVTEATQATFGVTLSAKPESLVLVNVMSTDMTRATVNPTALLFDPAQWDIPQTITVSAMQDDDAAAELTEVWLTAPQMQLQKTVSLEITDNDVMAILTSQIANLGEGNSVQFGVRLGAAPLPGGDRLVTLTPSSGAVTIVPNTILMTSTDWNVDHNVTITGVQDGDNIDAPVTITISSPGLTTVEQTITIIDDETLNITTSTVNLGQVTEGTTAQFTVQLTQPPVGTITVALDSSNGQALTINPPTMTFSAADFDQPKTATATMVSDNNTVDTTATVTLSSAGLADCTVAAAIIDDDEQALIVTTNQVTVDEGQATQFGVRFKFEPVGGTAAVSIGSTDTGAATALAAIGGSTLTFTTANYDQDQMITVTGVSDPDAVNESVLAQLNALTEATTLDLPTTVTDDDRLTIELDTSTLEVSESGTGTFSVTLGAMPIDPVTVAIVSSAPGALVVNTPLLQFDSTNYQTPQTVTVQGMPDENLANETVDVSLSAIGLPLVTAAATILDDDTQAILVNDVTVGEQLTNVMGVRLAFQPANSVTIPVTTGNVGIATLSAAKLQTINLTFTPANYNDPQNVLVNGTDDPNAVNDMTSITLGGTKVVTATVLDNDVLNITASTSNSVNEGGTATFTAQLTAQPTQNMTFMVMSSDTGAATVNPSMITFTPGDFGPRTITVTGVVDADQNNEAVTYTITDGTYTATVGGQVVDSGALAMVVDPSLTINESSTGQISIRLNIQPANDVTITAISADPAVATVGGPITFTPGNFATPQTITVTGTNDQHLLNKQTTISLNGNGVNQVLVTTTVNNVDVQSLIVTPSATLALFENGVGGSATGTVTVRPAFAPGGATNVDVAASSAKIGLSTMTLSFDDTNFQTPKSVTVSAMPDANTANEAATVTATMGGFAGAVNVTVTDDDVQGIVMTGAADVAEGSTTTFTVRLAAEPSADTTVNLVSSNITALNVGQAAVTFNASNYATPITITLTAPNDVNFDHDVVIVTASSAGVPNQQISVRTKDNDLLNVSSTSTSAYNGQQATILVKLNNAPFGGNPLFVTNMTQIQFTPSMFIFGPGDFGNAQPLTFTMPASGSGSTIATVSAPNQTTRTIALSWGPPPPPRDPCDTTPVETVGGTGAGGANKRQVHALTNTRETACP